MEVHASHTWWTAGVLYPPVGRLRRWTQAALNSLAGPDLLPWSPDSRCKQSLSGSAELLEDSDGDQTSFD